jgi:uncharacterized membrane protein YsdA (DUF1294 family)
MTFMLMAYDKYLAKAQKQRISERTLLSFAFIGGTIGSVLAMLVFRHKTSKISYLWKFLGILFIQGLMFYLWYDFDVLFQELILK